MSHRRFAYLRGSNGEAVQIDLNPKGRSMHVRYRFPCSMWRTAKGVQGVKDAAKILYPRSEFIFSISRVPPFTWRSEDYLGD